MSQRASQNRLIIFDCDGVLVDTETRANAALAQLISAAGVPMDMAESRRRYLGKSTEGVRTALIESDGVDLGHDFAARWRTALPEIFATGVPAIAGINDAIEQLQLAGHSVCVASSGTVEKMHLTLGSAGLLARLTDVLFSATMVERGKPSPDLFLHAANQMGFGPDMSIVIEDSPFGAQAAKAAGMACFGYCGDPLSDQQGLAKWGAHLFSDMKLLPTLVAEKIGNQQWN